MADQLPECDGVSASRPAISMVRGIIRASTLIGAITIVVKVLGMMRDATTAGFFGTSLPMDAYLLALAAVTFFVNMFVGTFNAAYIPAYLRLRHEHGPQVVGQFQAMVMIGLMVAMTLLCAILGLAHRPILDVLAPRLAQMHMDLLSPVFLMLLPLLVISAASFTMAGTLQAEGRFALAAMTPAISILSCIVALFAFGRSWGPRALIPGLLGGGGIEVALLFQATRRLGIPWSFAWSAPVRMGVWSVAKQYFPVMSGALMLSSTTLVDMAMAGHLNTGAVSSLSYANKVPAAVLTVVSGALSTAILPYLSGMVVKREWRDLRSVLRHFLLRAFGWGTLIALVLILISTPLVRLVFQHGAFRQADTELVANVQRMYLLQVPFYFSGIILVRFVSAIQSNVILFYGNILSAGLNIALDLVFMRWMGAAGIALSTACVYMVSFIYLATFASLALRRCEEASA